jgi:hypothetical protein
MDRFELPISRRGALVRLGAFLASLRGASAAAQRTGPPGIAPKWNEAMELRVEVEVARIAGGRVRRPYVAIWVEDPQGRPVRTLSLWVQTTGRGPRWIPDLRRWFRGERERQSASGGDMVQTVSSATRGPGTHLVVWNGRDDRGDLVEQGEHFVCIEAVREHGSYGLIRERRAFGSAPFRAELDGNAEISAATLDFRRRA